MKVLTGLPGRFQTSARARWAACGVLAVTGLAAGPLASSVLSPGTGSVLGLGRTVAAGETITAADLVVVKGSVPAGWAVPASAQGRIIGQRARTELPAGTLLTTADVGAFPPTGMTELDLAVKQGQYPSDLAAGQRVAVFAPVSDDPVGSTGGGTNGAAPSTKAAAVGQVLSITRATGTETGGAVVELEVPVSQAGAAASLQDASLVALDADGDAP